MCTLLIMSLLIGSAPGTVTYGASNLKLYSYSTNKTSTYSDKQISYVYNGKQISLGNMPGILSSNGVALGSYVHIFQKTLGLKSSIDKKTKKITITDGNNKLVMTVGSKTAYVNGKAVTMNAAPVTYKYMNTGKALTLVPTRFVAETFGYSYNWDSASSTVTITKPLKLFYDNKNVNYTGITGAVSVDGKKVNVSNMPSILINNTAMVQAWKVFSQAMGVTYKIDDATGEMTFTKGEITVNMKINSTSASINGKKTSSGVAPRYVKNLETNKEVVLVPGSFLAKALGYDYTWDGSSKTSIIKTTKSTGVTSGITIKPTPTPGDDNSGTIPVETSKYFTWTENLEYQQELLAAKEAYTNMATEKTISTGNDNTTSIMNIFQDGSVTNALSETFIVSLNSPISTLKADKTEDIITLNFSNAISSDRYYSLNSQLVTNVETKFDSASYNSTVSFKLSDASSYYDMKLSEDGLSLSISIYPNYITKVSGGKYSDGLEYLSLTGVKEVTPVITEDEYYVYLTLPNTSSTMGGMQYAMDNATGMNFVLLETPSIHSSHFIIQKPFQGAEYKKYQDENMFHIYFEAQESTDDSNEQTGLKIALPSGVTASDISDDDQYYNKQIVLSMDGNYVDFYKANPITTSYDTVSNISVKYASGKTKITIKTTKVQGYALDYEADGLNITIANPKEMYQKIVVLDAGHGGKDPGTLKGKVYEKDIVFNILNKYAKTYFDSSDIKVYYSRVDDTLIDLYDRAAFADEVEADLFVSLHVNAASNAAARGTSVYYCSTNTAKTESGLDSKKLASIFVNNLTSALGTKNLGTINGRFVVIRENTVPAVLIETAFITNPSDYKLLVDTNFQKKVAKTIYETLDSVFDTYPTGR